MVALQRLVPLLSLCLGTSVAFKIYKTEDLESYNVGDTCVKALSADISCHEYIHSFMQPRYRGSLENVTLTDQICTGTCSASLRSWFNTVADVCADEDFGGGVPKRYGGYIWNGWNDTCIKDPKTKKYCNNIIDEFTELEDGEEMPRDEFCHICYRRRLAIMQSSSYSMYNHSYQSQLKKVYKTCGGSGPTEIPPPPKVEKPEEYCLTLARANG
ncbi:hypothetical protein DER46DRAFT_512153 [Fusarium sp. MPI-SDFR-AT-0072]|nr:hypothetical protein DER46DRAFT_512153 [Fusarium sp. MPI-SDFR-AT-0072]